MRAIGFVVAVLCSVVVIGASAREAHGQAGPQTIGVDGTGDGRPAAEVLGRPQQGPIDWRDPDFPPIANHSPHVWSELPPVWREDHSLVYDSRRDRFLVVGRSSTELWEVRRRPQLSWRRLELRGSGPTTCQRSVYDAANDRLIVLGAIEGGISGIWELPLKPPGTWRLLNAFASIPGVYDPTLALDAASDRVLIAGGGSAQVWQVGLNGGPALAIAAVPFVDGNGSVATSAFDPSGRVLYVIDNRGTAYPLNLSGPVWWYAPIEQSGVSFSHYRTLRAVPEAVSGDIILVSSDWLTGIRALSIAARQWRTLSTSEATPGRREFYAVVSDPVDGSILVHGGQQNCHATVSDLVIWNPAHPGEWNTVGNGSGGRRLVAAAVVDPARDRLIVVVTYPNPGEVTGTFLIKQLDRDEEGFVSILPVRPLPQLGNYDGVWFDERSLFFDRRRDKLYFVGRDTRDGPLVLWTTPADGAPAWSRVDLTGDGPAGGYGSIEFDERNDRLLLFGDYQGNEDPESRTILELPLSTHVWRRIECENRSLRFMYGRTFYDERRNCAWFYWRGDSLHRVDFDGDRAAVTSLPIENGDPHFLANPVFYDASGSRIAGFRSYPHGPLDRSRFEDFITLRVGAHPRWERNPTEGAIPIARYEEAIAVDEKRHRLMLIGGYDDDCRYFDNAYALSLGGGGEQRQADQAQREGEEVSVPPSSLRLALTTPGPAIVGPIDIHYALPGPGSARLELLDVSGRRLGLREMDDGASRSGTARLSEAGRLAPGVYFVRLRHAGVQKTIRVALLH